MQYSIIQNHSLSVAVKGTDTILFGGLYYNVYAPGLTFLSLPFAAIGIIFQGTLGRAGSPVLLDEAFLSIAASLSSLIMYNISKFYTRNYFSCLFVSLTLSLATSVWPFAVSIFPHDASLLFSILGVYLVLRYAKSPEGKRTRLLELAGLSIGIASLIEYAAGLLMLPLLTYLFVLQKSEGKSGFRLIGFLGTFALTGIVLNLAYNYALFGNPMIFPQQLYSDGLHFFVNGSMLEQILFNLFSPYRGVFLLSPVLVLGILGLYFMFRSEETRSDSILFLSLFLIILLYYSSWQGWDGGWSYGPRFLVLGLPYLVIPLALVIPRLSKIQWKFIFLALFGISCLVQDLGAIAGSAPPTQGILQYQVLSYAIPQILQGNSAVWWIPSGWTGDPVPILLAAAVVFSLIMGFEFYVSLRIARANSKVVIPFSDEREPRPKGTISSP
jgi:hypothetical protein